MARVTPWLPLAAGVGVLGLTLIGVIAVRHDGSARAAPVALAPVEVEFTTAPEAIVSRLDDAGRATPVAGHALVLAAGERAVLVARRAGYREDRQVVLAPVASPIRFHPTAIRGFEGVWRLPAGGELRAFARQGEALVESRLDDVAGPTTVLRTLPAIAPDAASDTGAIAEFEAHEEQVDARATDATCHFSIAVHYRYDARTDLLERIQEDLVSEVHGGRCVAAHRTWGAPQRLARVGSRPG